MKRFLLLGALLTLLTGLAYPVDFAALKPLGYVSDFAGVVDQRVKPALERYCAAVESSTGAQMAFVTLPTLSGEPVEDVANLLYRKWGIGKKDTDEGLLLLLVINDRKSRLEVGYGLEPYVPDGYAGSLLRQMRPALQAGSYGDAFAVAAQTLGNRIAEAKNVKVTEAAPRRRTPSEKTIPWGSLIGGAIFLLWMLGAGGRGRGGGMGGLLAGMFLGNMMGRGMYGGRSGGGFGGYDSPGGFGGFGGGDSGGGGASGSW